MKKIKELQKRSSLNEGRDYGIGFAILNKINNDKYETYNAFTACKDYLNDFSYVEYTKKEIEEIHGYKHKLLNCFDNKKHFYLGVKTLHYKNNNKWNNFENCQKELVENYKILEKFLNKIEKKLKLSNTSKITLDEDTLIIKAPIYWTKTSALISVYTLLIRCYFNLKELKSIKNVLINHETFIQGDSYLIKNCKTFYNNINLNYDELYYDRFKLTDAGNIHNFGISSYFNRPEIKKLLNDK
jgi:hypothetical protein